MTVFDKVPVNLPPRFEFTAVFRERAEYERRYQLPFNMVGICTAEDPGNPSEITNLHDGSRYVWKLNDIGFTPCGTAQYYRYTPANEHLAIHFRLEIIPGIDVFTGVTPGRRVFNDPALADEARAIFADTTDTPRTLARCQAYALKICERFWPEKYAFSLDAARRFAPVLQYVRENVHAEMAVGELARLLNCSEGHFSRGFHAAFNFSPKLFLQKELYAKAALALLRPAASVKEIAAELRFSSEFNFSRFFKRLSGLSPQNYQKTRAYQKMI